MLRTRGTAHLRLGMAEQQGGIACKHAQLAQLTACSSAGSSRPRWRQCPPPPLAPQIHGGNGYLIQQFMAKKTNQRTDGWGGDVAGRCRQAAGGCVLACARAAALACSC